MNKMSLDDIFHVVGDYHKLSVEELRGIDKIGFISSARQQVAICMKANFPYLSYKVMGEKFNRRVSGFRQLITSGNKKYKNMSHFKEDTDKLLIIINEIKDGKKDCPRTILTREADDRKETTTGDPVVSKPELH